MVSPTSLIIRDIPLSLTVNIAFADCLLFVVTMFTFAKSELDFKKPPLKIGFKRHEGIAFLTNLTDKPIYFLFMEQ